MNLSSTTHDYNSEGMLDYAQASAIGDVGERRVGDLLRSEAPALGYCMLDNLLLVDDQTTAQLDHVLVDRFGVVIVETKNYHALIRGKSDEKFWTACYSGKGRRRERFLNPLRQNDRHREMLHRVIQACGRRLPPEYVQSLVVFAGGNLAHLKVDDADALRVVPSREVVDYLRARCGDFQPNRGALDAQQVADLVSLLQSLNQARNHEVVAQHAANVTRASRRFGGQLRRNRPAPNTAPHHSPYGAPAVYNQNTRYPDGSQFAPARRNPWWARLGRQLLPLMLLLAFGWWFVDGGGGAVLGGAIASSILGATNRSAAAVSARPPTVSVATYDVSLARRKLKEASPSVYRQLANAETPRLSMTRGLPTYTWQYVNKTAANAVSVQEISVTLDAAGNIVGVTGGR